MPRPQLRPPALRWRVFLARQALDAGLLTPQALRGSAWQRLLRGVYPDSRLDPGHLLQCQAAVLLAPPEAVVAGATAAYLHGVESAAGDADPVQLLAERKHRFGPIQGVQVHTGTVPVADVMTRQELRCTTASRTAWDVALWRTLHAEPDRLHLDRQRLNALLDAGWLVLHATSCHLGAGVPGLVADVRRALRPRCAPLWITAGSPLDRCNVGDIVAKRGALYQQCPRHCDDRGVRSR